MSDDFNFDGFFDDAVEMSLEDVETVGKKIITKDSAELLKKFLTGLRDHAPNMKDSEGNIIPDQHVAVPLVWNRLPRKIREAFEPERSDTGRVSGGWQSLLRYMRAWQDDLNIYPKPISDDKVIHSLLQKYATPENLIDTESDDPDVYKKYTIEQKDNEGNTFRDKVLKDLDPADLEDNLLYGGIMVMRKNEWIARIEQKKAAKKKNTSEDASEDTTPESTDD